MMTRRRRRQLLLGLVIFAACAGGPHVAGADDVIVMKRAGSDDRALLEWITAPDRTFDLTDADVADLVEAGVSEDVIGAMLARSDEHHEEKGQAHEHEHE